MAILIIAVVNARAEDTVTTSVAITLISVTTIRNSVCGARTVMTEIIITNQTETVGIMAKSVHVRITVVRTMAVITTTVETHMVRAQDTVSKDRETIVRKEVMHVLAALPTMIPMLNTARRNNLNIKTYSPIRTSRFV